MISCSLGEREPRGMQFSAGSCGQSFWAYSAAIEAVSRTRPARAISQARIGKDVAVNRWQERFPQLFARSAFEWGGVASGDLEIQFSLALPPDELVSNVKVIGRAAGGVVVCQSDQGWRFLPGGTREAGEAVTETARRELLEEAGASIVGGLHWIGAFEVNNPRSRPYRPHLPHPVSYWLYVVGDVTFEGGPTNPADGEPVIEVLTLPPPEAVNYLAAFDNGQLTDVLRLAIAMGHV
jgi:8-oxo-dGTP diphosphatase